MFWFLCYFPSTSSWKTTTPRAFFLFFSSFFFSSDLLRYYFSCFFFFLFCWKKEDNVGVAGSFIIVRSFCYIRTHPFLVVWYFCSVPLSVVVVVVAFAGWCRCSSYYCYYYHHLRVQTGVLICTLYLLVDIGTIQNLFCSIFQAGFFFLLSFVYSRCFTWHFLFSFFFFVFFFFSSWCMFFLDGRCICFSHSLDWNL